MKKLLLLSLLILHVSLFAQNNKIGPTGSVGIGTTNPGGSLEVVGYSFNTGVDGFVGWTDRTLNTQTENGHIWGWCASGGVASLYDAKSNLSHLSISETGRISAYNPWNSTLAIESTGNPGNTSVLEFNPWNSRPGGSPTKIISVDANFSAYLGFYTASPGNYGNNIANEKMRLDADGNLGIGSTDTKGFKLAVNGPAIFTKVQVKAATPGYPWPDYVFHPTYNLRSLSTLEAYINENKHLPDVPSAEEVEKDGLDLGTTQAVLLKKIEELTLYVIEQGKEIQELKKTVKNKQ